MNITPRFLSGSTNGRQIKVVATSTLGTTIHTAVSGTDDIDEVYIYAVNSDTVARKLTIELGEVSSPDDLIEQTIQPESGLELVVPGHRIQNGLVITAFASAANVIMLSGRVDRYTA